MNIPEKFIFERIAAHRIDVRVKLSTNEIREVAIVDAIVVSNRIRISQGRDTRTKVWLARKK